MLGEASLLERVDGEAADAPPDASPARGPSQNFHDSLARLEMNSLEVKLFLDSIDQRISRMEPRLDEMRGSETAPAGAAPLGELDAMPPVEEAATGAGDMPGDTPAEADTGSWPGTERRRRSQELPVERRRFVGPGPIDPEPEAEEWRSCGALAVLQRRWIPISVVVLLTLMVMVVFRSGPRPSSKEGPSSVPVASQPVSAQSLPTQGQTLQKRSADVPYGSPGPEVSASSGLQGGSMVVPVGTASQATVPTQGVRAPVQLVAAPPVATGASPAQPPTEVAASPDGAPGEAAISGEAPATEAAPGADASGAHALATTVPDASIAGGGHSGPGMPHRIRVSSGVMAGNLSYSPRPRYPKGFAGWFHQEGEVVMQVIISKRGRVENLKVISGHYMLRGAAKDAVRTWRYRPYVVNGSPVEVATIVSVEFHR